MKDRYKGQCEGQPRSCNGLVPVEYVKGGKPICLYCKIAFAPFTPKTIKNFSSWHNNNKKMREIWGIFEIIIIKNVSKRRRKPKYILQLCTQLCACNFSSCHFMFVKNVCKKKKEN